MPHSSTARPRAAAVAKAPMAAALALAGGLIHAPAFAQDGALEALVAAAKEEGTVTLYSGYTPVQSEAIAAAFTEEYGIDVQVQRLVTGQLITRYAAEQQSDAVAADVVMQSDQLFVVDGDSQGWFMDLTQDDLPALAEWPQESWMNDSYAPVVLLPWGFTYNTDKLSGDDAPETWEDLLDPRFKGEILLTDPKSTLAMLSNISFLAEAFGDDYLEAFSQQEYTVIPSLVPGLQQLAAGEKSVVVQTIPAADAALIEAGAPLRTVIPDSHSGFAHYAAVSTKAPHPNAGKLLLNFMLTPEGQQVLVRDSGFSVLGEIEGAVPGEGFELTDWGAIQQDRDRLLGLLGMN